MSSGSMVMVEEVEAHGMESLSLRGIGVRMSMFHRWRHGLKCWAMPSGNGAGMAVQRRWRCFGHCTTFTKCCHSFCRSLDEPSYFILDALCCDGDVCARPSSAPFCFLSVSETAKRCIFMELLCFLLLRCVLCIFTVGSLPFVLPFPSIS